MSEPTDFVGTHRYAIRKELGRGGMGVVYEALDLEDGATVALKLLNLASPEALYQFKQEFRSLADIGHPNLVRLHELSTSDEHWFFTMEYIEGVHIFKYVRGKDASVQERSSTLWERNDRAASRGEDRQINDSVGPNESTVPVFTPPIRTRAANPSQTLPNAHMQATATQVLAAGEATGHGASSSGAEEKTSVNASFSAGDRARDVSTRRALPIASPEQFERLHDAFSQLARGLRAIHRAGFVHCDVKNSNVLVTPSDRIVILDYGLVVGAKDGDWPGLHPQRATAGTPLYMAPELFAGFGQTAASDMYAVGVMLYMVLSGFAPYVGSARDIREQKMMIDPPPLSTWVPDVPPALESLCHDLIQRDPELRPDTDQLLERLGQASNEDYVPNIAGHDPASTIVGREDELAILDDILAGLVKGPSAGVAIAATAATAAAATRPDVDAGVSRARLVCLHGDAGIGKSTILTHFEATTKRESHAVVLPGRCYERETVPYKALDSFFDALAIYLSNKSAAEVAPLLPMRIGILARMFPVLRQVELIEKAAPVEVNDPRASRREAVPVLRDLLRRIALETPLVVVVDDVQWGDRDSGLLLAQVLDDADPPPMLFILSYRTAGGASSPFLEALGAHVERATEIALGPLTSDDARKVAARILGRLGTDALIDQVAKESGGNAYFVGALASDLRERLARGDAEQASAASVTLEEVVARGISGLAAPSRQMLEILAVAGAPITQSVAQQAAQLSAIETRDAITELRFRRFARTNGTRSTDSIETYHDRVRETLWAQLDSAQRRDGHRRIAWALTSSNAGDAERLARHFDGAEDFERAGPCYVEAARVAAEALAFDRAAANFSRAIEVLQLTLKTDALGALRIELATALANAGRGREAAEVYLQASTMVTAAEAMQCRRRAAGLLLDYGLMKDAEHVLRSLLIEYNIPPPTGGRIGALRTQLQRIRLLIRGSSVRARDGGELSKSEAHRIDVLWGVAFGFVLVHPLAAIEYSTRALIAALDSGDRLRVARAIGLELALSGMKGRRGLKRNLQLMRTARELSDDVEDPYTRGIVALGAGFVHVNVWDHEAARRAYDVACDILRNQCIGCHGEANRAELSRIYAYYFLGELKAMREAVLAAQKDAEQHEEWQMVTSLQCGTPSVIHFMEDRPDAANEAREAMWSRWQNGFGFLRHYWDAVTRLTVDLYAGRWEGIWNHIESRKNIWFNPVFKGMSLGRMASTETLARAALAAAVAATSPSEKTKLLDRANRFATRLDRERLPGALGAARFIRGCVLALDGRRDQAIGELEAAEVLLASRSMNMHVMAARRRRGQLIGGDEGRSLIEECETRLAAQGVAQPAKFAAFVMPGDPEQ